MAGRWEAGVTLAESSSYYWHGNGDLCLGPECHVIDAYGDHPTADLHSTDWWDGYEAGQKVDANTLHLGRASHVGAPTGFAAYPLDQPHPTTEWKVISHDTACCASRGCHKVCSHLCGTDLHICDGTPHSVP